MGDLLEAGSQYLSGHVLADRSVGLSTSTVNSATAVVRVLNLYLSLKRQFYFSTESNIFS